MTLAASIVWGCSKFERELGTKGCSGQPELQYRPLHCNVYVCPGKRQLMAAKVA